MADLKRVTDANGRSIGVKRPGTLVLARAIDLSGFGPNSMTANLFVAAATVVEIDGNPVGMAKTAADFEAIINQLGDEGLLAVNAALSAGFDEQTTVDSAKN